MTENKIYIKRKIIKEKSNEERELENKEAWLSYWRANPHRFITDYLGLKLHDFQKVLIYQMNFYQNFIFVASRGLAKSTLSLLFSIQRCILYPNQVIVVVAPTKGQSGRFIVKVNEFIRESPNLAAEIEPNGVKTGQNESSITFKNGSKIFTVPYSENALGVRCNILIVDEFVRTEKEVISRVFVPFLTSLRTPPYTDLTNEERNKLPDEPNRQLYLSSIRGADEWSYKYFLEYVQAMRDGDMRYTTIALPHHFGVKNKFISKDTIEQSFKENQESTEMLLAEWNCIPERGTNNAFYKYNDIAKKRDNVRALYCMSDEEYLTYKETPEKWPFYQEKLANEKRILSMDIALVESNKNDNTAFWITRLIPDGGKYKKMFVYAESMHGINSIVQARRAKQLFYEFQCDVFAVDAAGVGMGVVDICLAETFDEARNETYPAWTVINPEDWKTANRVLSPNAVPVIYSIKTSAQQKSQMLIHSRDVLATNDISFLVDTQEAIDYLNKVFKYYKIDDEELKSRLLNPYVQTSTFVNEAINLESCNVGGYLSAKEKSGRRKDRVMSYAYNLAYAEIFDEQLNTQNNDYSYLNYVMFA